MARNDSARPFSTIREIPLLERSPVLLPNESQIGKIGRGYNRTGDGKTPINLGRRESLRVRQGLTQTLSLSRQGVSGSPKVDSDAYNRVVKAWQEITNQVDSGAKTIVLSPETQQTIVSDSNF